MLKKKSLQRGVIGEMENSKDESFNDEESLELMHEGEHSLQ